MIYEQKAVQLRDLLVYDLDTRREFWETFGLNQDQLRAILKTDWFHARLVEFTAQQEFLCYSDEQMLYLAVGALMGVAGERLRVMREAIQITPPAGTAPPGSSSLN